MKYLLAFIVILFGLYSFSQSGYTSAMMQNTYILYGDSYDGNLTTGTGFVLIEQTDDSTGFLLLITAKHVFDNMKGDTAVIVLREKVKDKYFPIHHKFAIRKNGINIYTSHHTEDVAVIRLKIPSKYRYPGYFTKELATNKTLKEFGIEPGVKISCLGFPLVQRSNEAFFPILRTGVIASYPLFPLSNYPTFLFDVTVFKGNSGGPVFYAYHPEFINGQVIVTRGSKLKIQFFIIGLISAERIDETKKYSAYKQEIEQKQLYIAEVVHAKYIIETIDLFKKQAGIK